jgi:pantoate--beta-alanine ligase
MKILFNKNDLIKLIRKERNIGFVPTMGAIHVGHSSLIKKSTRQCNKTIVSIYVNRPQFNKVSDYKKYPKNLKNDFSILKKLKIDYLFIPKKTDIYPKGPNKKIKISSFSKQLCGKHRPGHFESVVDVIERFVKIINPKKIYLGKKDMQQLKIIEYYLKKKYKNIKVVGCKTIREENGLAYSSRNSLLSKKEKVIAGKVYKIIKNNKGNILKKNIQLRYIIKKIKLLGIKKIDYLKFLDINNINKSFKKNKKYRVFISYYLGSTRLIDNI